MQPNDIIPFGPYAWRVLSLTPTAALLLTEEIIDQQPYHNAREPVTWATSAIRHHLNTALLSTFTPVDQARILPTPIQTPANPWYNTPGGDATVDKIFLLSLEEAVCLYFGDSSANLQNRSPKQRYWFQKKDANNPQRRATYQSHVWWWWLRTPGRDNRRAIYIHGDGNIGIQGNGTFHYSSNTLHPITGQNHGGVRPALWLSR